MSCHLASGILVSIGLAFEVSAILWLLWSVGGDRILLGALVRAKQAGRGLGAAIRSPWRRRPVNSGAIEIGLASDMSAAGRLELRAPRGTMRPTPGDLAEVGVRLNELYDDLNKIDERLREANRASEERIRTTTKDLHDADLKAAASLEDRIDEAANQALSERTREGILFAFGLVCQFVASILLLVCALPV